MHLHEPNLGLVPLIDTTNGCHCQEMYLSLKHNVQFVLSNITSTRGTSLTFDKVEIISLIQIFQYILAKCLHLISCRQIYCVSSSRILNIIQFVSSNPELAISILTRLCIEATLQNSKQLRLLPLKVILTQNFLIKFN